MVLEAWTEKPRPKSKQALGYIQEDTRLQNAIRHPNAKVELKYKHRDTKVFVQVDHESLPQTHVMSLTLFFTWCQNHSNALPVLENIDFLPLKDNTIDAKISLAVLRALKDHTLLFNKYPDFWNKYMSALLTSAIATKNNMFIKVIYDIFVYSLLKVTPENVEKFAEYMIVMAQNGYLMTLFGRWKEFLVDMTELSKRVKSHAGAFFASQIVGDYIETIGDLTEFVKGLSHEEWLALYIYKVWCKDVNDTYMYVFPGVLETVNTLTKIFAKAPRLKQPLVCWRGEAHDVVVNMRKVNRTAFKSTTFHPLVTYEFMRGAPCCVMKLVIEPGTPIVVFPFATEDDTESSYKDEFEVLLHKDTLFEKQNENGKICINPYSDNPKSISHLTMKVSHSGYLGQVLPSPDSYDNVQESYHVFQRILAPKFGSIEELALTFRSMIKPMAQQRYGISDMMTVIQSTVDIAVANGVSVHPDFTIDNVFKCMRTLPGGQM